MTLFALFRLGFPTAPAITALTLPRIRKSLVPSPKGTSSLRRAPTLWRHKVSGSISLPFRGSFNLSLTVLVHYRSHILFSLRSWSTWIHTGFHVADATYEHIAPKQDIFQIRDYYPLWSAFPDCFSVFLYKCLYFELREDMSYNPHTATGSSLALYRFGLFQFRSSLLSESRLISFPCLLRYFNSAGVHPYRIWEMTLKGSPIRKSWAVTRRSSLPRLIAALCVLHRIYESRHPLCAVSVFIHLAFCSRLYYLVVGMNKIFEYFLGGNRIS